MRRFVAPLLCVLYVGCNEPYRPAPREAPTEPAVDVRGQETATEASPESADGAVDLPALRLAAPQTWVRKQPRSGFVTAEFSLPRVEGDAADGRLTVSVAGGSVEANIDRWRKQFEGENATYSQEEIEIAGTNVTVVDFSGTFNDQAGPFAAGVQREGYRMLGAIIPVSGQLHFVKAYGPAKTMSQHEDSFRAFLQSLELK